ncbi:hypothetical protein SMACR_02010 [Sordaria macrospora]|uniref:Store-operated calcium entry-associated regulatory factor n=2 Tax=Sordaria macrospora TaxID=5147 RepID=F7VSI0_SORMK|nr:uncharacterized protein SMAC_02010 [Sordaria macrospora k-hell]KAA8634507.1 hypothetical protein SMACR_02010 [Sordaria macrospora]KAH7631946.1 hypothetical protein B0T09DRAFT_112181 [Sordaria sp. MPI-SDFR-AT-0083]WPJ63247.1 hypothetical protein SMAC4_02010 [Sordaria macrospora]CCC08466.1 unnamed protein product [Sordaria macrospora k-hell]
MRLLDPSSLPSLGAASLLLLLSSSIPGNNGPNGAEAANSGKAKDAVLLSNIRSLTLTPHSQTTSRRLPPIPQLQCLPSPSSPLCRLAEPHISVMRCTNQGSRYGKEDIQWSCTVPSLPTTLQLGSTDVVCEGYDGPDDEYVLKGSCGVEYRLTLTEEGRRKYGDGFGNGDGGYGNGGESPGLAGYLFGVLFVGVLGWIVYSACVQAGQNRRVGANGADGQRRGWGGGGGGPGFGGGPGGGPGGGDWDGDEPPPPYPGYGNKPSGRQQPVPGQQQQGWRPGFWSGIAGGAAAGYLAGQRGGQRGRREDNNRGYNYGSTWGGGSSSGSRNRSWGSSSGDNGGSSGTTHESTGFGSTSRR